MLRLLSASLLVAAASASYCGDSSIPFSLEVLPDGGLVLGCARPTCFGWGPTGTPATNNAFFYRINNLDDGFMRSERDAIPAYDQSDARYYNPQTATCEQTFASANCAGINQWVGGIAPLHNVTAYPIVLRCCSFDALLQSEDRGLAIMHAGQIVVGGEVINSGIQAGFDYISDIAKNVRPDGNVVYDVAIRRMPCAGLSDGVNKYRKNAQAYQAPTVTAEQALPLPPAGSNSQNGILEEIIQEEAIQLPPGTQFQQPIQPPVGPQGPVAQAPVGQAVAPQYYPAAPVQFYSGGGGGGGQWCFSGDMTVEVMDGTTKRMDQLTKQDWVLAVSDKQLEYVPVEFWLHRVPAQEAEFNEFETEDGKTIKLTDKHYIFKGDCSRVGTGAVQLYELPRDAVFADQVHAGDCLFVVGEHRNMHEKRVVRASKVTETGIYAPMTSSGRIIVNGIHASCHNIFQEHTSGHAFFKYVDMFNDAYESLFGTNTEEIVETPAGLSLVIAMADLVVPKNLVAILNFANPLHYAVRGKRVLEDAACDLIDLVDCSENEKDESVCLNTVNGYVCCICIDDVDEEQLKESLKSGKGSKAAWTWNKAEREAFIAKWTKKEMRRAWDPYTDSLHH
ncbi:hypothetical protein PRIPAC_97339 [Pristionchus pacificus]|uniref:HintN domain-containing protein n=1 Tax=Pristionchus pacificus TaxID=54126 RepID=A0A2A6BIU5_PRIPA|nr:hypothetical protein PRIPAC_97339 [Pristionchus pacificus]|eukprot:PDM65807.1 hypothetical protein PRIPAC_45208 [Pristionchus pacificus]